MAKEKNEHNDRYMTLKRLKRHGTLYSQEKQELLTHIGCHCKYTHENDSYLDNVQAKVTQQFANNREHFCNQVWVVEEMRNYGLDYIDTRATTIKKTYSLLLS